MKKRLLHGAFALILLLVSVFLAGSMRKRPAHAELSPIQQAASLFLRDLPPGADAARWEQFSRTAPELIFQAAEED